MMNASLVQRTSVGDEALTILSRLGATESAFAREGIAATSPITGEVITHVRITSPDEASAVIGRAAQAFDAWRKSRRRGVGSSCEFSRRNCAPPRMISPGL